MLEYLVCMSAPPGQLWTKNQDAEQKRKCAPRTSISTDLPLESDWGVHMCLLLGATGEVRLHVIKL